MHCVSNHSSACQRTHDCALRLPEENERAQRRAQQQQRNSVAKQASGRHDGVLDKMPPAPPCAGVLDAVSKTDRVDETMSRQHGYCGMPEGTCSVWYHFTV